MRARDLLPWRKFVIRTSWSPRVAATEVRRRMGPRRFFGSGAAAFVGESLNQAEFRFRRAISYQNSFLPDIRVAIEPEGDRGARVHVRMRLHPAILAMTALWLGGATFGVLAHLVHPAHPPHMSSVLAMPVVGVAVMTLAFGLEARKAETMLREIYAPAPALDNDEPYR